MNRPALILSLALSSACFAHAQWGNNVNQTFLGPEIGIFMPTDGTLKDAIGDRWFTYGLGSVGLSELAGNSKNSSFNIISGSGNGSKVYILGYSLGMVKVMGDLRKASIIPYFALRGGAAYMDYAVNTSAVTRESGKRIGLNGNAELGVMIGGKLSLAARYDIFTPADGLRFDGLSFSLKYGISGF
ncbi:MAG: hypothetical protein ABUL72_00200 [Armatimonadota bacterium]